MKISVVIFAASSRRPTDSRVPSIIFTWVRTSCSDPCTLTLSRDTWPARRSGQLPVDTLKSFTFSRISGCAA
ncbi:hypothetical protein J6590_001207 [Homalodisca vitripennis]|nr:hypothetical protein J6590_001207 [Homalodisca vitripennis]